MIYKGDTNKSSLRQYKTRASDSEFVEQSFWQEKTNVASLVKDLKENIKSLLCLMLQQKRWGLITYDPL